MRKSYIATTSEASALHSGEQTAIIVKMGKQPPAYGCRIVDNQILYEDPQGNVHSRADIPYALNEPVYVREAWLYRHKHDKYYHKADYPLVQPYAHQGWQSPITMPRSSARTWFKPVSCDVVRVMQIDGICADVDVPESVQSYIISKLGQSAWDNNDYVFYYKIEKI
jgi:hypothetical protein